MKHRFSALFERRIRGFRVVELAGCALLVTLVLGVYAAKTDAGQEGANITSVQKQIGEEQRLVRLLRAELAHLEEPRRLERLSAAIGLQPVAAARETPPDGLIEVARQSGAHHP